ncbi:MAG: dihydropteroate synthase [Syntrophales bacterium]|jgi:dihydropteroate synthase|nr:dihydropteroate synthase [Syntrophales bacterium]
MSSPEHRVFRVGILSQTSDEAFMDLLKAVGVDPPGRERLLPKMRHFNILLQDVECRAANVIKQEMLALGGDAAVARGTVSCSIPSTDVILMGTAKQILLFAGRIKRQPFGLTFLSAELEQHLAHYHRTDFVLATGKRKIPLGDGTRVMGVVNVTPDSFSGGGREMMSTPEAIDLALAQEEAGADFIDIGGESSRPGAEGVSASEELKRVLPVIDGLRGRLGVPVSIDTMKAEVAREAVAAGAEIVNDISAMTGDPGMAAVVSETGAAVILMHMRGVPRTMQSGPIVYSNLMAEIIAYLSDRIDHARAQGIAMDRIMVDPGVGFGKTVQDNLVIVRRLAELKILGAPILVGVSRKSFIGAVTGVEVAAERTEGTAAALTASIMGGAHVVRVHDVAETTRVVVMTDAIMRGRFTA